MMSDARRRAILLDYIDGRISAPEAADALGPRTSISEVILEARAAFGRLPDRNDAFARNEYERARALLGLGRKATSAA